MGHVLGPIVVGLYYYFLPSIILNNRIRKRKNKLEKEKIYPEKIYIDINISENNSISISKIRLVFPDINSHSAERAVEITTECTGNEIEVVTEEW